MPTTSDFAEVIAKAKWSLANSTAKYNTLIGVSTLTALIAAAESAATARKRLLGISVTLRSAAQNDYMVDNKFTETGKTLNDAANAVLLAFDSVPRTIYEGRVAVDSASQEIAATARDAALEEVKAALKDLCFGDEVARPGSTDALEAIDALKSSPPATCNDFLQVQVNAARDAALEEAAAVCIQYSKASGRTIAKADAAATCASRIRALRRPA